MQRKKAVFNERFKLVEHFPMCTVCDSKTHFDCIEISLRVSSSSSSSQCILSYYLHDMQCAMHRIFFFISLLLPKLFGPFECNWQGNLGNLDSNKRHATWVILCMYKIAICLSYVHISQVHVFAPLCKKASNHHANLPLEMYSFTL